MKRSEFLKQLGLGVTAVVVAPSVILKAIEPEKIPEIDLKMETVYVKPKTLKLNWVPERPEVLSSYYGMDAEKELTMALSEQIQKEIDLEIFTNIL